jgi:hypothetical protein
MPKAYAKVWLPGLDNSWEHNQHCPSDFNNNCGGWVWESNRVARRIGGTQTRARCARICSGVIQYASGQTGNPCDGADKIRHINPSENLNGGAKGALECTFNSIDANKLKRMSGNVKLTNSSIDGGGSVYEQLLFGVRIGGYNTENQGFCENANNLEKVVDNNGDTCYKKIVKKLGEAVGKQKGIEYCNNDANKTDPKCKCINVSGSNFVENCRNNPSWAGCSEIITAADAYASVGVLQSLTGLAGGADCLVPGICSRDVYEPQTNIQSCANQIGICDQVLNINVDQIDEAAELSAFQGCDIQFEAARDRGSSTSGSPSGIPTTYESSGAPSGTTYPSGSISDTLDTSFRSKLPEFLRPYVPVSIDEIKTDQSKQLGVGGVASISMMCCCIILLLLMSGGSNKSIRPRYGNMY